MRALFVLIVMGFGLGVAHAEDFKIENNQLVVPGPIVFETGSDKLKPESDGPLSYVKRYLNDKTYITLLRIEVHTDNQGAEAYNQTLSEKRALSVARWLIGNQIPCTRLIAVGFGSTKPIADNATPDGRAQNRRTVFANAALRGRAIGGMPVDGGGKLAGDACK